MNSGPTAMLVTAPRWLLAIDALLSPVTADSTRTAPSSHPVSSVSSPSNVTAVAPHGPRANASTL
eukprot:3798862-Rhodomonas_salina.1